MIELYDSATPLAPVTTSTTRAKLDATDTTRSGTRSVYVQLESTAAANHFIGDVTVVTTGNAGVITELVPGQGVTLPVKSTQGLYVVARSGASRVFVTVLA